MKTPLFKIAFNDQSKLGCKDQESIQSSTTPGPGYQWESDQLTVGHYKREPRGQPFPSRRPQGTYKQSLTFLISHHTSGCHMYRLPFRSVGSG